MQSLPIDAHIPEIVGHVRRSRAVVVTAEPGAGKTTRVPPALVDDGPLILLQPRRVAARAMAQRIADERGWAVGREIGWQIRFDKRFSASTRLLVVTEGVLTRVLQRDPLLSAFTTIVLDEFHERSVHADVALALAKQAWLARGDLRIVVMSATLDTEAVSSFLGGCPVVRAPGRLFPIDIQYSPGESVASAASQALQTSSGDMLCFLPGAAEIRRAMGELVPRVAGADVEVLPLHGSLDASAQDAVLRPSARRRVIVATNIAETSLTVPGITAVVDSGLHKIARYDEERGIDSLELERITADAADQRTGRAGRLAPGRVWRLWDSRDRLRPHREPEIHRVDLSATALDVIAWGGDPRTLEWFERPRDEAIDAALLLLDRLGATRDGRLTRLGQEVQRLPIHPRLASMLLAAGGAREMARACALLAERHWLPPRAASTASDLLSAIDDWRSVPPHIQHVAREIEKGVGRGFRENPSRPLFSEAQFRRAVLAGYPDRVAQRREPGSPRVLLASGTGASLSPESGVREGEFLVAVDVVAPAGDALQRVPTVAKSVPNESRIRIASLVDREWLEPNRSEIVHRFDRDAGLVRASKIDRYDALALGAHPVPPDPAVAAQLLADAWIERGPRPEDEQLLRRLRFAGRTLDVVDLVRQAAATARSLDDVRITRALQPDVSGALDRDAPESIAVPSGRRVPLQYGADGSVSASVKLQELFGLAETPRVGPRRDAVLLSLLAPNGRPVQTTRDLRSFWDRTYPEVRKELRGRYPKHPWPDDPWTATPTSKSKSKSR